MKLHLEKMTEEQLKQALEITSDPNNTTIAENNGNKHSKKTELTENENNEQPLRRSTRLRSPNPTVRLGNPITH